MLPFEYKIRTRYSETGQDGVIHHSAFVVYLEEARIEYMKSLGFDINELEQKRIFCPVVELQLKYLKPLHSYEEITIGMGLGEWSKVRFSLTYRVFREGIPVAHGTSSHCFVNAAFKPVALPNELMEQFKKQDSAT
jgi:acyl-CoA thioester hydrolase